MAWPICRNGTSTRTPNASSTSADPLREVAARFPCLATRAPAAAATTAAAVEMLNASKPSPPVPQVSTIRVGRCSPWANTGAACRRITAAKPASSITCTGRWFSACSSRTISCVSTRPHNNSSITASASPRVKQCPPSIRLISVTHIGSSTHYATAHCRDATKEAPTTRTRSAISRHCYKWRFSRPCSVPAIPSKLQCFADA
jgi:hypothetical protein